MSDKPSLASVLDWYNIGYNPDKNAQKILCPIHTEFVPSCSINLAEGWYNCHACDSKGDVWNLIAAKEKTDGFAATLAISEEILANGGRAISQSTESGDDGLFGRKRSKSRSGRRTPYWPSVYSGGRP